MPSKEQNTMKLVAEEVQEPTKVVWNPEKTFLKGRSWAQMTADEEEEEEQERLIEEQERLIEEQERLIEEQEKRVNNIMAERRFLYSIGEYEIEEGELLE
jgi:hypothetical protein